MSFGGGAYISVADSDCGRATVMPVIAGSVLIGGGRQVQKTVATRVVSTRCGNVRLQGAFCDVRPCNELVVSRRREGGRIN